MDVGISLNDPEVLIVHWALSNYIRKYIDKGNINPIEDVMEQIKTINDIKNLKDNKILQDALNELINDKTLTSNEMIYLDSKLPLLKNIIKL